MSNCMHDVLNKRRPILILLSAVGVLSLGLATAAAETHQARPIRLIVPFAAGESNDISVRIVADELTKVLGRAVLVENRPGASGNRAAETVANAAPDGHTLLWAQAATHGINPTLHRNLGYDPVRDFTSIGLIGSEPLVLVTRAQADWTGIDDLVISAKLDPARIHFGSGGIGTTPHMAGELFAAQAGIRLVHVPYRAEARAIGDTIAGRIQLAFYGLDSSLGHIRSGALKPLAVTSPARVPALNDVPALAEMLPEFEVASWSGIAAPAGTPTHVVARLSQALQDIGRRPAIRERFGQPGVRLDVGMPQAMDAFVREQIARWRRVIETNGIAMD
jgi:tripartite-type tricarboxylate transporter receptor subunit TctC